MNFQKLFDKPKIIGLVADADEGKSNLIYHVLDSLSTQYTYKLFTYGLRCKVSHTIEIKSVTELEQIKNSIIIIDEMFSLFDLDNRKSKASIEKTFRLIFHNNNVVLLCGLGENFKKFLSAKLNAVIFKKVTISDLINGSQLKNIVTRCKSVQVGSEIVNLEKSEAIIYDGEHYYDIKIPYLEKYDSKKKNIKILVPKKVTKNVQKKIKQVKK